ncbi:SLC24A2, partial [Symbiodinium sp. CCMP2592]
MAFGSYEAHLASCMRKFNKTGFVRSWDFKLKPSANLFAGMARASGPMPPVMSVPVPKMVSSQVTVASVVKLVLGRVRLQDSWSVHLDKKLRAAIQKWVSIVLEDPLTFDVGRRCAAASCQDSAVSQGLLHTFSGKAAGTLHNRAGPLLRFVAWAKKRRLQPLPLREKDVYEFLLDLEDSRAPSFGKALMSSLAFCKFVLGAESFSDSLCSGRLTGLARASFLKKRKRRQKPPLTVAMVKRLGRLVVDESDNDVDRLCAGFFLLCIYLRARYSDGQALMNLVLDEPDSFMGPLAGYFQGETSRTKTSFSLERKTALLPMVGPLCGVASVPWFRTWMSLREDLAIPEGEDFPLLPSRGQEGGWSGVPPTATVAAGWLRGILSARGFPEASKLGTHSCKATTLSWMSKYGVDALHRRILGYHKAPQDEMMHIYGRDNVAPALRSLEYVLADIRIGKFLPDTTRPEFNDEPSASEASLDEEDNVQDLRAEEAAADEIIPPWAELSVGDPDAHVYIRHITSRKLHRLADEGGNRLRCGKRFCAMAVTESKANFSSRAKALGLEDPVLVKFVDAGIDGMSKYAFLSSYVPGSTDERPFTAAIVKVLGRDPSIAELSVLRRLLHESYNLTVSELQSQVERTDDSAPRKLAAPDRADRLQRQQVRLSGLTIHGPTLPGHAVIDKCVQMYEDNVLHYLPPQSCPCRDDEVKFKKDRDDKMLSVDGAGHVSLRTQVAKVDADVSSDLLLKLALTRRGLALDQARIVTFSEHERWVEALFTARFRDPPDNYARVTLQQLMQADRQLFVEAADRTRHGIQLVSDGKPVDKIWNEAMNCNNVTHLLQPLVAAPPAPFRPGPYDDRRPWKGVQSMDQTTDEKDAAQSGPNGLPSAEEFASSLIGKWIEQADVLKLFDCLPKAAPQRGSGGGISFATGAFAKVKVGLRSNVAVFPKSTQVLAAFVRQSAPAHKFTTVVLSDGVRTAPHRDQQNSFLPNLAIPLSRFTKGAIWVQSSKGPHTRTVDGATLQGVALPVSDGPVLFDARRQTHLTDSWQGRRVILVAFSISAFDKLSLEASQRLISLDFALPTEPEVEHFREHPQLPARLPWPPRFPLLSGASATKAFTEALVPKEPLFLELCAGAAMLSRCFREAGVPVMPIDHQHNRHHPLAQVCNLSLTEESTWVFLRNVVRDHPILFVHAAPPCGTCSAARNIKRKGVSVAPLRSPEHPMGLPSLTGVNLDKVEAANKIYVGLAQFLDLLCRSNIPWTVENPESSMLWQLPCFAHLVKNFPRVNFDMCCYGGARLTHRTLLTSCDAIEHFRQRCPGGHDHLPWKPQRRADGTMSFPTAQEAAYPRPFCQQFVALVFRHLGRPLPVHPTAATSAAAATSSARQPRGRKLPPVMPEFKRVLVYQVHALPPVDSKRCILQPLRDAPSGSKLLSSTSLLLSGGGSGSSLKFSRDEVVHSDSSSSDASSCESVHGSDSDASCARTLEPTSDARAFEVRLGVYASPDEFLDGCRRVTHPFDHLHAAPDRLKQCIFDMLVNGPTWVVQRRAALLRKWTSWASDLEGEERALKEALDPQVAKVLQGKRLKLLERIAGSLGWVDMKVFDELRNGFDLVGHHEHTGVFAHEPRPPKLAESDFISAAQFLQPALLGKIRASASDANARELWDKTLDEVADGILEGPLSAEELLSRHGPCWLPTRRFGVEQTSSAGRKLRPVDDFTENKVNLAFGSMDKLDLHALDELIGISRLWIRVLNGPPDFTIPLSTGESLSGRLHDGWKKVGCEPLLTTLDLRAAYKQFAVSAKSRALAIIALLDPSTAEPGLFESKALPFGSSASVLHFNRLARLFWRIGVELCVPWCNFYDDFPVMSPSGIADNTMETMIALCLVLVRNKPGRAEELIASLDEVLEEGLISRKRYLSLMGRLHYTDSYILVKAGRLFMAEVRSWAKSLSGPELKLDECVRSSLERLLKRFRCGTPRHVPCSVADHVVHIYTDGASEGSSHTVGGVLMLQNQVHAYFGCSVPDVLVSRWADSMCHFIGPIEAYAVAVARKAWHQFIAGHRCIFYIDNVPAQDAFIKGTSVNHHVRDILLSVEAAEELSASWSWFARVASQSNVA